MFSGIIKQNKMKKLTEDEFYEQFTIRKNHLDDNASFNEGMYETYGAEIEYVFELSKRENRVWTIIEGDDDTLFYVTGFHYVNRLGFLITEETYNEEIEVKMDVSTDF